MNEEQKKKQQPKQLPFPLDVSCPWPTQQSGEGGKLESSDDQQKLNGRCCE
jgi:hypothetical protein